MALAQGCWSVWPSVKPTVSWGPLGLGGGAVKLSLAGEELLREHLVMPAVGTVHATQLPTMDLPRTHLSSISSMDRTRRHCWCVTGSGERG